MVRKSTIFVIIAILGLAIAKPAYAKRLLPRVVQAANNAATSQTQPSNSSTRGVNAAVKFRADRQAIVVDFSNLAIATSISYMFTYDTNGLSQGAAGSVDTSLSSVDPKELIFGSCSTNNVCRYDTNITNARFVVTTTLPSGIKIVKAFRLKV